MPDAMLGPVDPRAPLELWIDWKKFIEERFGVTATPVCPNCID